MKSIVEQYYPPLTNLRMGQMLWFAVAKEEKGGYGKSMKNLRLRPVVLSAVTYEDVQKRAESVPQKEIRKSGIARMLREADEQGGTLAETDLSLILSCSLRLFTRISPNMNVRIAWCCHAGAPCMTWAEAHRISKSSAENQFRIEKLRRTSQGKLITVPMLSTDILAILNVCASALRKGCRRKRSHSQHN
jgi:hypothetical protein